MKVVWKARRVVASREQSLVWEGPAFPTAVRLQCLLLPCVWDLEDKGGGEVMTSFTHNFNVSFLIPVEADCVFKSARFSSQPWRLSSWNIRGWFLFIATLPLSPNRLRLPQHSLSCPSGGAEQLLVALAGSSITFILLVLQVSWCPTYK